MKEGIGRKQYEGRNTKEGNYEGSLSSFLNFKFACIQSGKMSIHKMMADKAVRQLLQQVYTHEHEKKEQEKRKEGRKRERTEQKKRERRQERAKKSKKKYINILFLPSFPLLRASILFQPSSVACSFHSTRILFHFTPSIPSDS
jgi:hypothetical protein